MKTRIVEWNWENPSIKENNGHNQSEWGQPEKKNKSEQYFNQKFFKTTMSNKIKCSHILVEKQSEALAILERIKKGEKFGKLAKELSTDSGSAKRDGSLGYFGKGMMVKPFEEVAFKLQVGELSEPVKSEFGYHLIKRLG